MPHRAFVPILACALLAAAPAGAEPHDCGTCTELDRATMADPVAPSDLPPPRIAPDTSLHARGEAIDVPLPGQDVTVFHKKGSGLWLSDLAGGNVYVKPQNKKLTVDLKYGF
ncbi:MAG: hypothetical protein K2X62_16495 [Beijerinckiaceae bacterium]|jgi:hypothetical protein|nr:hypothetical protein [Beijerinckiaceae bacterium]